MDTLFVITWIVGMVWIVRANIKKGKHWEEIIEEKLAKVAGAGAKEDYRNRYVIAYDPFFRTIGELFCFMAVSLLIFGILDEGWDVGFLLLGTPLVILGVTSFLGLSVWQIVVNGEQIVYRGYFGKIYEYKFSDITSFSERPNGAIVMYSGKKRLFSIDNNLMEQILFQSNLHEHDIPKTVSGMTFEKFTLKPRMVYYVVCWMGVGTHLLLEWGLIEQYGFSLPLFAIVMLSASPYVLLLLDFYLDRFTVEGTKVMRRRGLRVVRFDLKDVEYIKIKRNLFRENTQFYINGKKVTHVWNRNFPHKLLEQKCMAEGIRRKKQHKKR